MIIADILIALIAPIRFVYRYLMTAWHTLDFVRHCFLSLRPLDNYLVLPRWNGTAPATSRTGLSIFRSLSLTIRTGLLAFRPSFRSSFDARHAMSSIRCGLASFLVDQVLAVSHSMYPLCFQRTRWRQFLRHIECTCCTWLGHRY